MAPVPCVYDMSGGSGTPTGPPFNALDELILAMLADEQWTTGAIIGCANKLARRGALNLEEIDEHEAFEPETGPTALRDVYEELREDAEVDDDGPVQRHDVYDELKVLSRIGSIERAHPPTSMHRLADDEPTQNQNQNQNQTHEST